MVSCCLEWSRAISVLSQMGVLRDSVVSQGMSCLSGGVVSTLLAITAIMK